MWLLKRRERKRSPCRNGEVAVWMKNVKVSCLFDSSNSCCNQRDKNQSVTLQKWMKRWTYLTRHNSVLHSCCIIVVCIWCIVFVCIVFCGVECIQLMQIKFVIIDLNQWIFLWRGIECRWEWYRNPKKNKNKLTGNTDSLDLLLIILQGFHWD